VSESEPGADLHIWETRYAALGDDLQTSSGEALPELLQLVEEMLGAAGYKTAAAGMVEAPEVSAGLASVREVVDRLEGDEEVSNDDLFHAAATLRDLYRGLLGSPEAEAGADPRGR
jgi:hypothetical protein